MQAPPYRKNTRSSPAPLLVERKKGDELLSVLTSAAHGLLSLSVCTESYQTAPWQTLYRNDKANAYHCLSHRLCRGGQDHSPPQADICRGQTSSASSYLLGIPYGR